jgi:hypothetical protein
MGIHEFYAANSRSVWAVASGEISGDAVTFL